MRKHKHKNTDKHKHKHKNETIGDLQAHQVDPPTCFLQSSPIFQTSEYPIPTFAQKFVSQGGGLVVVAF